jgi:predicted RNase H-like nuclease
MLNGADLFQLLQSDFQLFDGSRWKSDEMVCFETFPHAVACAPANMVVSAKEKRRARRAQLAVLGVDLSRLTNIDVVDATLCAVTAQYLARGNFQTYGDAATGFIVTPPPAG